MAVNKLLAHVVLIPEDDKNRQIANGFRDYFAVATRRMDIRNVAGGWTEVLDALATSFNAYLRRYPQALLVLLIDFDGQFDARSQRFQQIVPDDLRQRVFLLGSVQTPERLISAVKLSAESLGRQLARDCELGETGLWQHEHLRHNEPEVRRLRDCAREVLFPDG